MITLLHGDYVEASRNELRRLIDAAKITKEVRMIDGTTTDDSALIQALESSSLFGNTSIVVIERLFSKLGRQQKRVTSLSALLSSTQGTDVILWEDKEIGAATVKQLGVGANVRLFKLPVLIFQFLDGIRPGNAKNLITTYQKLIATEAPELVFSMTVKRMRQLIQLNDNVVPLGLASWQASRLTTQAKSFTMDKLLTLYEKLHRIEVSIKSGESAVSLSGAFEGFLTEV